MPRAVAREAREVEQHLQGVLHLERRLLHHLQPGCILRRRARVFEQEVDEADRAEEWVGHVVRNVGCELAERGRSGERDEQPFDRCPVFVR